MSATTALSAVEPKNRRSLYFFLSYAHSAPFEPPVELRRRGRIEQHIPADADPVVGGFFEDLVEAVRLRAQPTGESGIGFFDQHIPAGASIKDLLTIGLESAEVFVPLYSPGYFAKAWPLREREVFRQRLQQAGASAERHIVPLLWTPFPSWQHSSDVDHALRIGSDADAYRENGLRALRMLRPFRATYEVILARVADAVVAVAERSPLGPSVAPSLDDVAAPDVARAEFAVTMLGAGDSGRQAPPWWSPYRIVDHAGNVAERLGLGTRVADYDATGEMFARTPAVVLVDLWAATRLSEEFLVAQLRDRPPWVAALVLVEPRERSGPNGAVLGRVADALASAVLGPVARAANITEFDEFLPSLVAQARGSFLRLGPTFAPKGATDRPTSLRDGVDKHVEEKP